MLPKSKQAHVDAWVRSELTKSAYCRERGLNIKTFSRWCGLAQTEQASAPPLLPVKIKPAPDAPEQIRLTLASGCVIELPSDIPPSWLGELLQCLV